MRLDEWHAVAMLALVVATVAILLEKGARCGMWNRVGFAALASFVIGCEVLVVSIMSPLEAGGTPGRQFWLCVLAAGLLVWFLPARKFQALAMTLMLLAAFFLCEQFNAIVGTGAYIDAYDIDDLSLAMKSDEMEARRLLAGLSPTPAAPIPAGWIDEQSPRAISPSGQKYQGDIAQVKFHCEQLAKPSVTPLWHSWWTGIYALHVQRMGLWYPGGLLRDNLHRIELPERGDLKQ